MIRKIIIGFFIILICSNRGYTVFENHFSGNARYIGLSGTLVGGCNDSGAIFINPAGLCKVEHQSVEITLIDLYEGIDVGNLYKFNGSYCINLNKYGNVGIGMDYLLLNVSGDNSSFKYGEVLPVLSYAHKISTMNVGINMKFPYWYSNLDGDTKYKSKDIAMGIDIGIMKDINKGLSIGGVIYNINQPYVGASAVRNMEGRIPISFKMGMFYDSFKNYNISFDMGYNNESIDPSIGIEYSYKVFKFRGGLLLKDVTESNEISTGIGYLYTMSSAVIQIDYALRYSLGSIGGYYGSHFLSLSFKY